MTHADDVIREYNTAPTLNARMGTGGNQVPILTENIPKAVIMGHDERSAHYNTDITDPLTACDYKQPQIVAQVSNGGGTSSICDRQRTNDAVGYAGQGGKPKLYARSDCGYAGNCNGKGIIGSLCAHDGRGFNGQDVQDGKLIVEMKDV